MERSRAGHGACRVSLVVLAGSRPPRLGRSGSVRGSPKHPLGFREGSEGPEPEGADALSGRRAIRMISRSPPSPLPLVPRNTPVVSAPWLDSLCFGNTEKRPLPLGYMFFLFVSFFLFSLFLFLFFFEHSDNQPQTRPQRLPAALSFARGRRPEGSKGKRRGLWAKGTGMVMVTHLLIGIPAGLAGFCRRRSDPVSRKRNLKAIL